MKGRLPRIYYLIPAVYVAVILFFLLMHFQARQDFEHHLGNLLLRGSYTRALGGRERIRSVEARFHGIGLRFSPRGVWAEGLGQIRGQAMPVESFSLSESGARIGFRGGLSLRLALQPGGERVDVAFTVPEPLGGLTSLAVAFTLPAGQAQSTAGLPLLSVGAPGGSVYLALPEGSEIDLNRKRLLLRLSRQGSTGQANLQLALGGSDPYRYWFSAGSPLAGEEDFQRTVGRFVDRAYGYWGRLLAGNPGRADLAGAAGAALVSEAVARGEYRRTLGVLVASLRPLFASSPDDPHLRRSAAYFGGLPGYLDFRETQARAQVEEITRRLQAADPAVFQEPELLATILDHGPLALVEEALRLAEALQPGAAAAAPAPGSPAALIGLLEFYLDALRLLPEPGGAARRTAQIVEQQVFPAIRRSSRGLFLDGTAIGVRPAPASPAGSAAAAQVDVLQSIRAGRALVRAGGQLGNETYAAVGRSLVSASLALADAEGFLPARLTLAGGEAKPAQESLAPEQVYLLVAGQPYIPREYPLYRTLGPGSWVFTVARLEEVKVDASQQRFFFTFPAGDTHYLLIQGVAPASSLLMHGIPWKSDPQYFQYSDGWAYDAASQTLYLKITHRATQEEIVLSY